MALKGAYNFKGIALSNAYLQISDMNCSFQPNSTRAVKTAAVYNADGTVKDEVVYETTWEKIATSGCSVKVFKDEAAKDANPENYITAFGFSFTGSLTDSAKNHIKQAYVALKADDKYKDYTDV